MVIARTDAVAVDGVEAAIDRAGSFVAAGADVVFVEALEDVDQLRRVNAALPGVPLLFNAVEGGRSPDLDAGSLEAIGVRILLHPISLLLATITAQQGALAALPRRSVGDDGHHRPRSHGGRCRRRTRPPPSDDRLTPGGPMPRLRQVHRHETDDELTLQMYDQPVRAGPRPGRRPGTATGTPGDWWTVFALSPDVLQPRVRGFNLYRSPNRAARPGAPRARSDADRVVARQPVRVLAALQVVPHRR